MKTKIENVKAILFDMDGVVLVDDAPIAGAADTLRLLTTKGIPYRFLTNTTTKSREGLHAKMTRMGLPVARDHIFTTHQVAAGFLRRRGNPPCYLLVAPETLPAYEGVPVSDVAPKFVVIGDIGDRWSYALLNRAFNMIMAGAEIVALHKGRYWQTQEGLKMDIGAFVAGLEYTTGKTATVLGKPAKAFFQVALDDMKVQASDAIMVGDDIESDIGGAKRTGIRGVLVKTGKYRKDAIRRSRVIPDAVIDSVASLVDLL